MARSAIHRARMTDNPGTRCNRDVELSGSRHREFFYDVIAVFRDGGADVDAQRYSEGEKIAAGCW